ncbi:GNAT family N-acetyltransferase [Chryseobacterium sp.]|uniref:GNAT family N-acetyltransferase n=1 Tax=Chryseobacterium sp. TaxID=1871047 RepID=UPI0038904024
MKYLLKDQETERLIFRKLEHSDFHTWQTLFEDDVTTALLGMSDYKTPQQRCEIWFEWTFHRYENELGGQNVLISKEDGSFVGQCGVLVREINNEFELEIAYSILPQHRLKGYAIEAAKKCRDFAFKNNFHDRLVSLIFPDNTASKNVALKNGMTFEKNIDFNHKNVDLFQIKKSDWEAY